MSENLSVKWSDNSRILLIIDFHHGSYSTITIPLQALLTRWSSGSFFLGFQICSNVVNKDIYLNDTLIYYQSHYMSELCVRVLSDSQVFFGHRVALFRLTGIKNYLYVKMYYNWKPL